MVCVSQYAAIYCLVIVFYALILLLVRIIILPRGFFKFLHPLPESTHEFRNFFPSKKQ